MTMLPIIIFAVASGLLLDVLVGLLGSRRNIGFGWVFLLSVLFSPIVGLIVALLSEPLPQGAEPKYGCLGYTFGLLGTILVALAALAAITLFLSLLLV